MGRQDAVAILGFVGFLIGIIYAFSMSLTIQIARLASDHHGIKWGFQPVDKGQNHFAVVQDSPLSSREEKPGFCG